MSEYYMTKNELYHHGIKGQKWGERRWQNEDGSLTSAGREHYGYGEARSRVASAKAAYKSANREYSKSYDKAVNLGQYVRGLTKKGREENKKRYEDLYSKAQAAEKARLNYKQAKKDYNKEYGLGTSLKKAVKSNSEYNANNSINYQNKKRKDLNAVKDVLTSKKTIKEGVNELKSNQEKFKEQRAKLEEKRLSTGSTKGQYALAGATAIAGLTALGVSKALDYTGTGNAAVIGLLQGAGVGMLEVSALAAYTGASDQRKRNK